MGFFILGDKMKDRTSDRFWFPWWPDKWIFGSIRIEFSPAERGIWVDMLSLASKDDGHIRANEDTPYPIQQLAGMLIIPEDVLIEAIEKFIKYEKLTRIENETLYVTKWDKYQFTDRHKRRINAEMSEETDTMSEEKDAILNNSIENKSKENKHIDDSASSRFEELWKGWPAEGRQKKQHCHMKFIAIQKNGKLPRFIRATQGYFDYLKHKREIDNFDQKPMHLSTFLNNWEGTFYENFEYKAKL